MSTRSYNHWLLTGAHAFPLRRFISIPDLSKIGKDNAAKMGPTPTSIQGMRLAMGHAVEVDNYRLGKTGPHKDGRSMIDPKGTKAWLESEKTQWGWQRDPGWKLGVHTPLFVMDIFSTTLTL